MFESGIRPLLRSQQDWGSDRAKYLLNLKITLLREVWGCLTEIFRARFLILRQMSYHAGLLCHLRTSFNPQRLRFIIWPQKMIPSHF